MFLLVYSTIKIRDAQRLPLHLQPRKDQLKSFQYRLRRLQSQLVILPCKNTGRKKKIRLWSTLFSSSTSKMIHVIEKKILPPSEERSTEKENFWLNDDTHGLFSSRKTYRLQKNEAPRFNANFRTQDPTRFSVQEQSSLNTRIVDSGIRHFIYITNDVNFTSKKKNGSRTSPLSKSNFEHDRQHVNNVTRVTISESEDFER